VRGDAKNFFKQVLTTDVAKSETSAKLMPTRFGPSWHWFRAFARSARPDLLW